ANAKAAASRRTPKWARRGDSADKGRSNAAPLRGAGQGGSGRSFEGAGTFGLGAARNKRKRAIGSREAENPWVRDVVEVGDFDAELGFGEVRPADNALPRDLAMIGLKIEEQIHRVFGELLGRVNAKAAAAECEVALAKSRGKALESGHEDGLGLMGGGKRQSSSRAVKMRATARMSCVRSTGLNIKASTPMS